MLEVYLVDATADAFEMVLSYIYTDRIHPVQKVGQEPNSNCVILLMMDVYRLALQVSFLVDNFSLLQCYHIPKELYRISNRVITVDGEI